jgi:GNAT superfamily N-acetyltransferase
VRYEVAPLSRDNLGAWGDLFRASGSACFCQYWHFEGTKNEWLARCAFEADANRQLSEQMLVSGVFSGVVALDESGVCVGWLKLSPAEQLVKLRNQSIYRTLAFESKGVLIIGCMLVHPEHRRRGVALALLTGAVTEAKRLGARSVEAYPHAVSHEVHDEQAFMGRASMFESCGFDKVLGNDVYPVYRLTL